ncbi:MAG TPA: hypothetical protein VGM06_17645 [Polyangiaceae bacterium]|jgi:hypothetical protein
MKKSSIVRDTVDGMRVVAILNDEMVTVLTDLAGPLSEVGVGRWDGSRFECAVWLGRDHAHSDMVHAAIADGLAANERRRPRDSVTPGAP